MHSVIRFANGYGASIIPGRFGNGFELAVIKFTGEEYSVDTSTPITGDVIPLDEGEDVTPILSAIASL